MSALAKRIDVPEVGFDSTLALVREGYDFVSNRCARLQADAFVTRLMLRPVLCAKGAEWARIFYGGDRFTRKGALPPTTVRLLQDVGSVQSLDGTAHRHRKSLFVGLLLDEKRVGELAARFEEEWQLASTGWQAGEISLLEQATLMLTRAACRWSGIPPHVFSYERLARDLDAMVANAGRFDPRVVPALVQRRRLEREIAGMVDEIRKGSLDLLPEAPAHVVATFRDADGMLLDREVAAVETLNLLRPIVAVGRFMVFCALALVQHREWRVRFETGDWSMLDPFVEEVRRYYPFFPFVGGRAAHDFEASGHRLVKGDWMLLDLYGTNHHPTHFSRPDRFDPQRSLNWRQQGHDFIPQGAGRTQLTHRCPGEAATVELMKTATRMLVAGQFRVTDPDLSLSHTRYPPMPRNGLRVRLEPVCK